MSLITSLGSWGREQAAASGLFAPLAVIVALCLFIYLHGWIPIPNGSIRRLLTEGSGIPGTSRFGYPLIGFLPLLGRSTAAFHDVLAAMAEQGEEKGITHSWFGSNVLVTIQEPELARAFLKQSSRISRDHPHLSWCSPAGSLKRMLGDSVFFYDDEHAGPIRNAIHKSVGPATQRSYFEMIKKISRRHVDRLTTETDLDIVDAADDFSTDLWVEIICGEENFPLRNPQTSLASRILDLVRYSNSYQHLVAHLLSSLFHLRSPALPDRAEASAGESFEQLARTLYDRSSRQHSRAYKTLARVLRHSQSEARDEVWQAARVALFSGPQSSKHYISWVLYELERNPKVMEDLHTELVKIMPARADAALTYEAFEKETPVLDAILNETARLYAPSFALVRAVTQEVYLDDINVKISPGTIVMVATQQMHTSRAIWGESALEWKPDRFLKTKTGCKGLTAIQRKAFIPMGLGSRACPGSPLAMESLKVYLILLLRDSHVWLMNPIIEPGFVSARKISSAVARTTPRHHG